MPASAPQPGSSRDEHRGIQNARVVTAMDRQEKRAEARQLRTQLLQGGRREASNDSKYWDASNDSSYTQGAGTKQKRHTGKDIETSQTRQVLTTIREALNGLDANISEAEMQQGLELRATPISHPDFPILILPLAILKDIVDMADATGFGAIVTTIFSFIMAIVLFIWFLGKLSGGWWKKGMVRWLWKRYALAIVIEFVPFLKIIPATTILVLMAHFREKKIVQLFNSALEELHRRGVKY